MTFFINHNVIDTSSEAKRPPPRPRSRLRCSHGGVTHVHPQIDNDHRGAGCGGLLGGTLVEVRLELLKADVAVVAARAREGGAAC